jgi:uncharacterized protein YndB with AHSA1/START domain
MTNIGRNHWSLDREIVVTRVMAVPRDLVFSAWMRPDIDRWFGPNGFTCTTREMNASLGNMWRFDLTGPDGAVHAQRVVYLEIEPDELLEFDQGSDIDDDPDRFRVTVTFDAQTDGKTVLTVRQLHPTVGQRDTMIRRGAVELGGQTLDRLTTFLGH